MVDGKLLRDIQLFKPFTDDELRALALKGEIRAFEPHANVVIEGEMTWGLFVILEGSVGVYKCNKLTGDTYDVAQLHAGSFFGEMSLVDEAARSATVRALEASRVFHISKSAFNEFLCYSSEVRIRFLQNCIVNLVGRLRELDENYVISQHQLWKRALRSRDEGAA
jgi:CRP-like cAMP-binding protein